MKDYTYEVRGVNDPIEGEVVRFHSKQEALEYSDEMKSLYPDNTVYMVEWEFDDEFGFDGAPTKTQEMQIRGPEVDANLADPSVPNSCDGDNPDNYDEEGNFRLPTYDDGLDDELVDEAWGLEADKRKAQSAHILKTAGDFSYDLNHTDDTDPTPIDQDNLVQAEDPKAELDKFANSLDEGTDEGLVGVDDIPADESFSEDLKEGTEQYVKLVNSSTSKFHSNQAYDLRDLKHLFKDCDTTKKRFSEKDINLITKFDNHCKVIRETDKGVLITVPCYYRDSKDRSKISDTPKYIEVWVPKSDTKPITESVEEDDDIESESFAEELFNALSTKRSEEAIPEMNLDLEAPHKDVPVVDCDVNPVITHSEDEKPLVESKQQNLISFDFKGNLEGCHFDIYNGDYEHADGLPTKPNQLWIDATINIDPEDGPSYTESNGYTWEEFDDKFYRFFDVSAYRELEDDDAITSELAEKLIQTIPTNRRDDFVSTLTDDIVEYNRNHSND